VCLVQTLTTTFSFLLIKLYHTHDVRTKIDIYVFIAITWLITLLGGLLVIKVIILQAVSVSIHYLGTVYFNNRY
jgi:hypothetical protein